MRVAALETAHGCGGRKKALEGEPHERIRSEIGPAGMGRIESVTRLRKPEDAGDRMRQVRSRCRCSMRGNAVGALNLKGGRWSVESLRATYGWPLDTRSTSVGGPKLKRGTAGQAWLTAELGTRRPLPLPKQGAAGLEREHRTYVGASVPRDYL